MYAVRPLRAADVPRLAEINPTFQAQTVLRRERYGTPPFLSWRLYEAPLPAPFEKGSAYDFDANERHHIAQRLANPNTLLEVVENPHNGRLVGILDVEEEHWRQSAWVWNLMLDTSIRGAGMGRRLVENCLAWARGRRLRAVLLETQSNNTPACHFYAHMGFQLVGLHEAFYTNADIAQDEFALFWAYIL